MQVNLRVIEHDGGAVGALIIGAARILGLPFLLTRRRGANRFFGALCKRADQNWTCVVQLTPGSQMIIRLADMIWMQLLMPRDEFEPAIRQILQRLHELPYVFVDGGASVGYWSTLASENPDADVIAIEPVAETFRLLVRNSELNGGRFSCKHAALAATGGENVRMVVDPIRHTSAHVEIDHLRLEPGTHIEVIETCTIDEVVASTVGHVQDRPLIVKLDVEGSEIAALQGASTTLTRNVLIIYEDHGKDVGHQATRYVMDELGLRVFYVTAAGVMRQMTSLREVGRIKRSRSRGYNFVAMPTRSPLLPNSRANAESAVSREWARSWRNRTTGQR